MSKKQFMLMSSLVTFILLLYSKNVHLPQLLTDEMHRPTRMINGLFAVEDREDKLIGYSGTERLSRLVTLGERS